MTRSRLIRRTLASLAALGLAANTAAFAQPVVIPVAAPDEAVTTLSPLIVSPLAPVPEVGAGAPYFMPQELADQKSAAIVLDRHTRWGLQDMRGIPSLLGPKKEVFMMDFGLEALCDTLHAKGRVVIQAAEAADRATQAAIAARAAEAQGEGAPGALALTELARQDAVRSYMTARWEAQEAEARVSDFNNIMQNRLGLWVVDLKGAIDERTQRRAEGGGAVGADEFADLSVLNVVARQQGDAEPGVLAVSGAIHNPRGQAIAAPPLVFTVLDRAGLKLTDWEIAPARNATIPAGGDLAFTYELKTPPAHAKGVILNFAPSRSKPSDFSSTCEISYHLD